MYSETMRIKALASLAATASGLEDAVEREKFKQDFIAKAVADPEFIPKMIAESERRFQTTH